VRDGVRLIGDRTSQGRRRSFSVAASVTLSQQHQTIHDVGNPTLACPVPASSSPAEQGDAGNCQMSFHRIVAPVSPLPTPTSPSAERKKKGRVGVHFIRRSQRARSTTASPQHASTLPLAAWGQPHQCSRLASSVAVVARCGNDWLSTYSMHLYTHASLLANPTHSRST